MPAIRLRFDLLVEFQHNANLGSYDDKFRHYDAFLTGWCLEHPRFKQLRTRPVVVIVAADAKELLELARKADHAMKGGLGNQGTPPQDWYYPARDHIFFALEEDIHRGSLAVLALPAMPPDLRARLGSEGLELGRVTLLPDVSGALVRLPRGRDVRGAEDVGGMRPETRTATRPRRDGSSAGSSQGSRRS